MQDPVTIERKKKFGFSVNSKPLTAQISINKEAFVSGESILISGVISNQSNVRIEECHVRFAKTVNYHAGGTTIKEKAVVFKCKQPGVDKESCVNWENIPVPIPSLPPSDLDGCKIISIHYKLSICFVPHGIHNSLEFTFPITIGTIPFEPGPGSSEASLPPPYSPSGAGSVSGMSPYPGATNYNPPSGSLANTAVVSFSVEPPPYSDGEQTSSLYVDHSGELPSYDSLFGHSLDNNDEEEDGTETYQPMHPTFNISH
jgi:hypothetical protein